MADGGGNAEVSAMLHWVIVPFDAPSSSSLACKQTDKNIEMWKIKRLIKALESARGAGTSMISLVMPPKDQVSRVSKMLGDEYGTASNIKSRVNRLSVLSAITSTQQRLKVLTTHILATLFS